MWFTLAMEGYEAATYGERIAEVYDSWYGANRRDAGPAVEFLAGLAQGGRALELGIGTGRVAIPLSQRGVEVVGIDASEAMVAKLRAKPGGDGVEVVMGTSRRWPSRESSTSSTSPSRRSSPSTAKSVRFGACGTWQSI